VRLSKPPFLATWLLNHFLPSSENDHITGDLMEAYDAGRSRIWYWKEVIAAITIGVSKETVRHPLLALRAISFGWGSWLLYVYSVAPKVLYPVFRRIFTPSGYPFSPGRLMWTVTSLLVMAGSGWIVARFHRPNRITTVLLFALSVFIVQFRIFPSLWSTAANSLTNTRFLPYLIFDLEIQILFPAATLFGGLFSRSHQIDRIEHEG
jgi:hypothetical protein